ncbi:unnamed protein product, partial [Mesorhabditis belari]|uniref:CX domain-containing protein n=1 Tax=Mesorhabditis belari TaxID=2138241 RepID=A0AAF3J890_9BILA
MSGTIQTSTYRPSFVAQVLPNNNNFLQRQFDASQQQQQQFFASTGFPLIKAGLVRRDYNQQDPNFYDCVYAVANTANTVTETCYKEIGCCEGGCCPNSYWHEKYGWAVALIVIFCIFVIIGVAVWLVVWLMNRSRDKQMRRDLASAQSGISPAHSQTSLYNRQQTPIYAPYGQNLPAANAAYKY